MEKAEGNQIEYIKSLEESHEKLMIKYEIVLKTMGSLADSLKEVQNIISDVLSQVLKL